MVMVMVMVMMMETRFAKRRKLLLLNNAADNHGVDPDDQDHISHLPDHILHHVFLFLPINSIARTSVLSKRWKILWYSFPDLDFSTLNTTTTTHPSNAPNPYLLKPPPYVDHILHLLHKHSDDIRLLKFRGFSTFSKLSGLIRHAVKHNVQELDLEVSTCDCFNFPRSIITSGSLRTLRLKSWNRGFRLPPSEIMKDGLGSLTMLSLSRAVLHDRPSLINLFTCSSFPLLKKLCLETCYGLKHLRVECPALEELCLEGCFELQDLEICVQKLQRLRVSSCFVADSSSSMVRIEAPALQILLWSYNAVTEKCSLQNLECLQEAFVGFYRLEDEDLTAPKIKSVRSFLTGISCCQSLTLESQCIELISKNNPASGCTGLSISPFNTLKSLEFTTRFAKHNNGALASLFRSCPILDKITMNIKDQSAQGRRWNNGVWESGGGYWESQAESLKLFLDHIKDVTFKGFTVTGCANYVSLVKFVVEHGKVLQQLYLVMNLSNSKPRDSLPRQKIKSLIMGFSPASSNAKIVFE